MVQAVVRVLFLVPGAFVGNKGALKGLDVPAAERRPSAAPEVPHEIELILIFVTREKRPARAAVSHIKVRLSAVSFAEVLNLVEAAVVPERHAAVIEQIAVATAVHSALFVQKRDVAPENRAVEEGIPQSVDDLESPDPRV